MPTDSMIAVTGEVERVTDFEKALVMPLLKGMEIYSQRRLQSLKGLNPRLSCRYIVQAGGLLRDSQRNSLHPSFSTVLVQR